MLSFSIIGCGAAGNKATIDLMNIGYNPDKCYLFNSTDKDIPKEYRNKMIIFGASSNRLGGCGKERSVGRDMLLADLKLNRIDLDSIVSPEDQAIILVGSTEGGSGSSSIPILAKYFKQVHGKNVICILFFGFNDDVRGMKNSIDLCKELSEEYTVIGISNEKFLNGGTNKFIAEKAANNQFCDVVKILSGAIIVPGIQMIDDTDLYKVVTTPGYMIANSISLSRPKTMEDYDKAMTNFLNNQGFVDPSKNPGAKRIAMIFDVPDDDSNIDYTGSVLRKLYGEPYEFFTHMNNQSDEYRVSFIVSGMKLPSEEIQAMYDNYVERTSMVNKDRDDFFDIVNGMNGPSIDEGFDMMSDTHKKDINRAKHSFFSDFESGSTNNSSEY